MKRYFVRFRVLLLTIALGLAIVSLVDSRNNAIEDEALRNALIIKPVFAPRFSETWSAIGRDRQHSYGYVTNDHQNLTTGNLGCDLSRAERDNKVYKDVDKVAYRVGNRGKVNVRVVWSRSLRCIDGPNLDLDLELAEYLKGTNRDPAR
jgi:hypothetical protein